MQRVRVQHVVPPVPGSTELESKYHPTALPWTYADWAYGANGTGRTPVC